MLKKEEIEKKSDIELVREIKSSRCNDSLMELIKRHSNLCYEMYKRYLSSFIFYNLNIEDVYSEKDYIIYHSAETFKEEKNVKFNTWLANQVRYRCIYLIKQEKRKQKKLNGEIKSFDEIKDIFDIVCHKSFNSNELKKEEISDYLLNLLNQFSDERIKRIYFLRYFGENTNKLTPWAKVAEQMNLTAQGCINIHNEALKLLKKKIKSKNFSDII